MDHKHIPELPVPIVNAALAYAKQKHHLDLNRDLLTELYWKIRWRRDDVIRLRKRNPTVKVSTGFYAARDWVLDRRFPLRGPADQPMRQAYSSALGKIANEFRKRMQPGFNLKRTELDRIMDLVTLDKDRHQYRLII